VVSGGHTSIYDIKSYTDFCEIGATRDDAAGEAFDKVGRVMGMPYPAGAEFDKTSHRGNPEAIKLPSPALSGDTLEGREYTFFMSSDDGRYEYLHLMKERKTLTIPASADGAELFSPVPLCDGVKVEGFEKSEGGYLLSLSGEFDETDTVIRFERVGGEAASTVSFINDTDKRIRYEGEWKYCHLVGNKGDEGLLPHGCFESDYHRTESAGASLFVAFEGDFAEVYGNLRRGNSSAGVYIDGIELGTLCTDSETAHNRELLFRSGDLHGGWHTLYIVNKENKSFEFDALKIISRQ
jgi:hypothetical protein